MGVSFVALLVSGDKKRSAMEVLLQERYTLFRIGVQPSSWSQMTKWERTDILFRYGKEQKERAQKIRSVPKKKRIWALIQAALARVVFR